MSPKTKQQVETRPGGVSFLPDVVGIVATFLPQTTEQQRSLMLVSNTWYRGVIEQDGMKPKPGVFWPWCALKERQPSRVTIGRMDGGTMERLAEHFPNLSELKVVGLIDERTYSLLPRFTQLRSLHIQPRAGPMDCIPATDLLKILGEHLSQHLQSLTLISFVIKNADAELIATILPHLTTLDLTNGVRADFLVDECVESLVKLPQLRSLNLRGRRHLTDRTLELLGSECPQLECLRIPFCQGFSKEGVSHLSKLQHLQVIDIGKSSVQQEGAFSAFAKMEHLTEINLDSLRITEASAIENFSRCKQQLKTLDISDTLIENGAQFVQQNPNLTSFIATRSAINDDTVQGIATTLPHLTKVSLGVCYNLTSTGINEVAKLRNLHTLSLNDLHHVTDETIAEVTKNNPRLTALGVTNCSKVTEAGLCCIGDSLHMLKLLEASLTKMTSKALVSIVTGLPHLTSLDLNECEEGNFTDEDVCLLCEKLTDLRMLNLGQLPFTLTDAGFSKITNLRRLQQLDVSRCDITDGSLALIAKLPVLEVLHVVRCGRLTQAGASLLAPTVLLYY